MTAAAWLQNLSSPDKWHEMLLLRGPQIATWTLALALAVEAATLVTDLAGARRVPANDSVAGPAANTATVQRVDVAAITRSNLFGVAQTERTPAEIDVANAPSTNVPLVLSGIIAQESPDKGFAIIGQSAAAARVHAVGDTLPGGVRLHSVYGDRVLIERDGRVESLALPRRFATGAPPPPPPSAAAPAEPANGERVRQLVAEQPGMIADVMRPQPVFVQGRQQGYRVYPGRNREAFLRLGLRPGDLVVSINGTPLDDPARGPEIFRTIGASSEVRLTVMRNGREQELTLDTAQLANEAGQLSGQGAQNGGVQSPPSGPETAPPAAEAPAADAAPASDAAPAAAPGPAGAPPPPPGEQPPDQAQDVQ